MIGVKARVRVRVRARARVRLRVRRGVSLEPAAVSSPCTSKRVGASRHPP